MLLLRSDRVVGTVMAEHLNNADFTQSSVRVKNKNQTTDIAIRSSFSHKSNCQSYHMQLHHLNGRCLLNGAFQLLQKGPTFYQTMLYDGNTLNAYYVSLKK